MTIREIKSIDTDKVRMVCIQHGLYTRGTNEEYTNLFKMCKEEVTTELLYKLAVDIVEHSRSWNTDNEQITNVMYLLNKHAVVTYYEIEE